MTIHGSKGLSATVVFILGLDEEVLPDANRARYVGQVIEAARMRYVSITRARLACVISYSTGRFNGRLNVHHPSRFAAHLNKPFRSGAAGINDAVARQLVEAAAGL